MLEASAMHEMTNSRLVVPPSIICISSLSFRAHSVAEVIPVSVDRLAAPADPDRWAYSTQIREGWRKRVFGVSGAAQLRDRHPESVQTRPRSGSLRSFSRLHPGHSGNDLPGAPPALPSVRYSIRIKLPDYLAGTR
jgi:hypothetical protein